MCTLFDEIAKESEKRGEKRGRAIEIIETGKEFHLSENDTIERLQRKLNITPKQAQTYLTMYRNGSLVSSMPLS